MQDNDYQSRTILKSMVRRLGSQTVRQVGGHREREGERAQEHRFLRAKIQHIKPAHFASIFH